jgi:hypothetical protein
MAAPADEHPLVALLSSIRVDKFRYGPDKPLVVLRSHWPVERALKVLLRHSITCAVRRDVCGPLTLFIYY